MLQILPQDHEEIRGAARSLRNLLVEDGMPIGHWFATTRWALTRRLLRHIALGKAAIGGKCTDGFERRYRDHVAEWTPDRIDSEWSLYCSDMRNILDTLDQRIASEARDYKRSPQPTADPRD